MKEGYTYHPIYGELEAQGGSNPETALPELEQGSALPEVMLLQARLKAAGCFPNSVTGSFGRETEIAVRIFQELRGLPATGVAGGATWDALLAQTAPPGRHHSADPTLRKGDTGPFVEQLQKQLAQLTYYGGPVSGVFDAETEAAVKRMQANNRLLPDGVAGGATWDALSQLYAPMAHCGDTTTSGDEYTVKAGDTLYSIARRFNVTVEAIMRRNGLTGNRLDIGQKLLLPFS